MSFQPVTACVLLIGNELLSGRTQDANLAHLATTLNEVGVSVHEARVIPDDRSVIIETLNSVRARFDYVFTTGGIGPTHDDITAECVADAFAVPLVMNEEIAETIRGFAKGEASETEPPEGGTGTKATAPVSSATYMWSEESPSPVPAWRSVGSPRCRATTLGPSGVSSASVSFTSPHSRPSPSWAT